MPTRRGSLERGDRKTLTGIVVSDKMQKTVVVRVELRKEHPRYQKVMVRSAKYKAHDEYEEAREGDRVLIMETRPYSATKNWRLIRIVERAK